MIGVAVMSYSKHDPRTQAVIGRDLQQVLTDAARAADLDRNRWGLFHTGDGELAILPDDVHLPVLVDTFVPELQALLVRHNQDRAPAMRMQLRIALHLATVIAVVPKSFVGADLVFLAHLLDSPPVRETLMEAERAELALILSEPIYENVEASGIPATDGRYFARVVIDLPAKAVTHTAYLHVPGYDMNRLVQDATWRAEEPQIELPTASRPLSPADPRSAMVGRVKVSSASSFADLDEADVRER
jgi:hypothetical protein